MTNNNIQELYEIAGIERNKPSCLDCFLDNKSCRSYAECSELYPPFTAEKQLELIKWLGLRRHLDIDIYSIKGHIIYDFSNDYDCITDEYRFMFDSNNFEDALAGLVNQVWHSLTEEERKQIKEILQ